ncbi:efflux RND transporter periplasmic adaptor subunit [Maritimibacter sp. DP1N21-5]|uniref:efflux RND transporter periplasmic adaptor subunit n=1 Tax=Maritimibacter sp. DP1N21-5 TaxID=2836867 RepID=UPI001C472299|nr:efflux RND transporter periplasmic adaptor subunit [Maritimibacter sp. DP1N21-5]MBV7410031.1 efflux RND transporter periplasmic adaptor subunit [Maritimibacter sp. DP1N21-5]
MRPIPILTALLTVTVLFLLVFQREWVRDLIGTSGPDATIETVSDAPDAAEDAHVVSVVAQRSSAQEIDSAVLLRGETQANREVALMAETAGRVVSSPIAKGAEVAQGDLLCELDPGTKDVALAQAQATLAEAERNLANAESLSQDGFAAETRVLAARTARESAQAAVAQAERALADTRITAPFPGVLETDTAEIGSLLQPGSPCATLVDLSSIKLVGYVAEADITRVSEGSTVGARLSTGQEVMGNVSFVGRSADAVTRTFRIEARVPNPDMAIRAGQTADILIQTAGRTAHLVPQSALTLNDDGDLGVRVVGEGTTPDETVARFAPVDLIRDTLDGVWVAGLPEETAVIVVGQDYVVDGVAIDVTYREPGL